MIRLSGILTVLVGGMALVLCLQAGHVLAEQTRATAAPAALTEVERLKVENLNLKVLLAQSQAEADGCRGLLGQFRARVASVELTQAEADIRKTIEAGHPGYRWNSANGQLERAAKKE